MAGNFASSTFSTGAQDSYRAVDVYSQNGTSTVTSYTERSSDSAGLSGIFGTSTGAASVNALSLAKNSVAYGKQVMGASTNAGALDRAVAGLGNIGSSLKGASPGLQSYLLGGIQGTQSIYATVMGSVQRLKSGNLPDIRSVSSLINSVAGSGTVNLSDNNSIVGMTAGLVSQATSMGIPKSFSALTKNLTGNPSLISNVINKALPAVTKSSDIGTLKEFALADPIAVKSSNPNILGDFSFNYVADDGTTQVAKVEQYKEVKETFSLINPDWTSATRSVLNDAGQSVPTKTFDLSTVCNGSDEFKDMMKMGAFNSTDPLDKLFLATDAAPTASVRAQLTSAFPMASVSPVASPTTPLVEDPSQVSNGPTVTVEEVPNQSKNGRQTLKKTVNPDGSYTTELTTYQWQTFPDNVVVKTYDRNGKLTSSKTIDLSNVQVQ